jgi:hypothetical protein
MTTKINGDEPAGLWRWEYLAPLLETWPSSPARPNGWSTTGYRLMLKFVKIHYFYYFSPYFSHYFYAICT